MKKKSWKGAESIPRVLMAAIRKGLKIADSISCEESDDKSSLRITFKKLPVRPADQDRKPTP